MTESEIRKIVVGVIPARGGSSRLPGKNILPVRGKPLIAYTIQAAREARLLGRIIVSTDDEAIALVSKEHGVDVFMRPQALASNESPIDETYRHVLERLQEEEGYQPHVVVGMQANVPVRKRGEIDAVVDRLLSMPWATAVATAKRVSERPEWMKELRDPQTWEIGPVDKQCASYRMQDLPDLYLLDGATIAVRADVLRRTRGDRRVHAYCGDRLVIHVHARRYSVEIDDIEDVQLAEYHLAYDECATSSC